MSESTRANTVPPPVVGSDNGSGLDWRVTAGLGVIGGSILVLSVVSAPFLLVPASRKLGSLPWMATPTHTITRALRQIHTLTAVPGSSSIPVALNARRSIVDLGSGDGRLCIEAAKHFGYRGVGIELNPVLVALSYYNAWRAGRCEVPAGESAGKPSATVLSQVTFQMQDFWSVPLSTFDVITVFGVRSIMERLEAKLTAEAEKPLYVACYRFPLPTKQPVYSKDELFIYRFDKATSADAVEIVDR